MNSKNDTIITVSCNDINFLQRNVIELGLQITEFKVDLLAHQNKVRKIILDSGEDIT